MAVKDAEFLAIAGTDSQIAIVDDTGNIYRIGPSGANFVTTYNGAVVKTFVGSTGSETNADDIPRLIGTSGSEVSRLAALNANTALTSVVIGTPVVPAIPANSVILSNLIASGDIVVLANDGSGNSWEYLRVDGSADLLVVNEGGSDIDFRLEGDTNANMLVVDAGTDSAAVGVAVVAGAGLTIGNLTGRTVVTSVGTQVHIPAATHTVLNASGTIAIHAPVVVGAETLASTGATTYTDAASVYVASAPVAGSNSTLTRKYGLFVDADDIRVDGNLQVNNTAAFGTTQPTAAVVMQSQTAPVGTLTTGSAIFSSTTVVRKIIADGTASNVET